ncbi:two-component system histidine kinase [Amycolatopsis mediterranei S699]|uniref:Oxygen sensor histidine kinase NreB n=3 Tax=Amycolatopsis mediterranei TaxID=33910 RepID=A0A0H3D8G5_AMYMU|nr:sensor histidine kinase [Amycolatopsis mediterranei]ADJ47265.1 two-component system histidine kinase [Amycolatopsis mediterranei U32]AEK44090.1 two-component system histidine kinase [Amycolatopsis mediterranei S699]AFO78976.1 two-component system histidine kinase [Amycolatopsis mediterranei S699]AGT86104.1 two-component system histidine kinase [Amycolatopsis mediterranei RB]KDO04773.1 histidine kinase [Amycolatopsis mediterranei]
MLGLGLTGAPPRNRRFVLTSGAHLAFFALVGVALIRLDTAYGALCWAIVTISGLLAVVYVLGQTWRGGLSTPWGLAWVAALVVLWALIIVLAPAPLTDAYVWCAVPLAYAGLHVLDHRAGPVAVAVITVVLVGRQVAAAGPFALEAAVVPVVAVWATLALHRAQQRNAAERQRLVDDLRSTRDVLAEEQRRAGMLEERARIARDLHDSLAQELSGSVLMLQATERNWPDRTDAARARVREVVDRLQDELAETRRVIRDLAPSALSESGLDGALRLLCARAHQDGTAAQVRFQVAGTADCPLDEQTAATLFRVAQSVLANVREHARAVNVQVTLRRHPELVELEISDDGAGFDPAGRVSGTGRGLGLPAARTRLDRLGGALDVDSTPGRGTRVTAMVPTRVGPAVPAGVR